MKSFLTLLVLVLAACSTPQVPNNVDLNFVQMQPVSLDVASVQVLNASSPSTTPKGMTLKNASPAGALERYASNRLKAAGAQGTLNFIIQQASITSREVAPTASGKWTDKIVNNMGKQTEHTITMKVGLDLASAQFRPGMKSAYAIERKLTIPAEASLVQRDHQINELIQNMVRDMDAAVIRGLTENMGIVLGAAPVVLGTSKAIPETHNQIPVMLNNAQ